MSLCATINIWKKECIFLNVSLTPELEKIINFKIQSGLYNSATEVVRESIRLLQERDELRLIQLESLRREVEEGVRASEEGRVKEGTQVMTEIKEASFAKETKLNGTLRYRASRSRYKRYSILVTTI